MKRSVVYDKLDPSEKGATSYFLGLTCAKLFAEAYLSVPWLMHLDVYGRVYNPRLWGDRKPDLVGINDRLDWAVIEAKGRTGGIGTSLLRDAKQQTRHLRLIGGQYPALRVASVSYFVYNELQVTLADPEDYDEDSFDVDLSQLEVLAAYYEPYIQLFQRQGGIRETQVIAEREFVMTRLGEADLIIGIDRSILARELSVEVATDLMHQRLPDHVGTNTSLGRDGIFVELGDSWNEQAMQQNPPL